MLWLFATDNHYGVAWFPPENRVTKVHRISYSLEKGPIPIGYDIDHICETLICIFPGHLDAVTRFEHKQRSIARHGHYQHKISFCPKGHEYSEENTFRWKDGKRRCITCEKKRRPDWIPPTTFDNLDGDI
jgi:hypothetical protein